MVMERNSVDQLSELVGEYWDMYRAARASGQLSNANAALREVAANVERLSTLSGEMAQVKAMSLKDVTIDEKLITAFLQAAMEGPDYIKVHLYSHRVYPVFKDDLRVLSWSRRQRLAQALCAKAGDFKLAVRVSS